MRRYVAFAFLFLLSAFLALPAFAYERDKQGRFISNKSAVGFHSTSAPIGARIAVAKSFALDLGVGFSSSDDVDTWAFDGGIPITLKSWQGARALFRPGILVSNYEAPWGDFRTTTVSAELEGEAFLVSNFSVSAAMGLAHESDDSGESSVKATGGKFTNVGFHLYLWR